MIKPKDQWIAYPGCQNCRGKGYWVSLESDNHRTERHEHQCPRCLRRLKNEQAEEAKALVNSGKYTAEEQNWELMEGFVMRTTIYRPRGVRDIPAMRVDEV